MKNSIYTSPKVFNVFKPVGITSYDVVRHFKRHLPKGFGKIGHFGTLDPFACGVFLIGINGATKINNMVHDMFPKTYLAVGKLGVATETGDLTVPPSDIDNSRYFKEEISRLPKDFLNEEINKIFLGKYMQSPHTYSAAKYEGKALHEWARNGVKIKKEQVRREIFHLEVVRFQFPWLSLRATVSSGTYVRSLFSDIAKHLGTFGCLQGLVREQIGPCHINDSLKKYLWPKDREFNIEENGLNLHQVLPLKQIEISADELTRYRNGIPFGVDTKSYIEQEKVWVKGEGKLVGMGMIEKGKCKVNFNISN